CEPPELVDFEHYGNDFNNVCGWTAGTAPSGYFPSYTQELDCNNLPETMNARLANAPGIPAHSDDDGIWYEKYVAIIDPAQRCGLWDREFTTIGKYCMKVWSPFLDSGVQLECEVHVPEYLTDTFEMTTGVQLDEPGWVM